MDRDLVRNLLETLPYVHKKLLKSVKPDIVTKQEMHMLHMIRYHTNIPMSEYGEKMGISKPNLSKLIQGLMEKGYIEKQQDQKVRRVFKLELTASGEAYIEKAREEIEKIIEKKLSKLDDKDLEALNGALKTIQQIIDKVD